MKSHWSNCILLWERYEYIVRLLFIICVHRNRRRTGKISTWESVPVMHLFNSQSIALISKEQVEKTTTNIPPFLNPLHPSYTSISILSLFYYLDLFRSLLIQLVSQSLTHSSPSYHPFFTRHTHSLSLSLCPSPPSLSLSIISHSRYKNK